MAFAQDVSPGVGVRRTLAALPSFVAGLAVFAILWWLTGFADGWWRAHHGAVDALFLRYLGATRTQPVHQAAFRATWLVRWVLGLSIVAGLTAAGAWQVAACVCRFDSHRWQPRLWASSSSAKGSGGSSFGGRRACRRTGRNRRSPRPNSLCSTRSPLRSLPLFSACTGVRQSACRAGLQACRPRRRRATPSPFESGGQSTRRLSRRRSSARPAKSDFSARDRWDTKNWHQDRYRPVACHPTTGLRRQSRTQHLRIPITAAPPTPAR
jgi:hypothetical protein